MDSMQTTILVVHTLIALGIVGLVLIQRGKGADAGAAFGSGGSGTVFGAKGTTSFFSRVTAILATAFFATSLTLAYLSSQRGTTPDSLLESLPATEVEQQMPVAEPANDGVPSLDDVTTEAEDAAIPALETEIPDDTPAPQE
jgi:preprotein translocase subunit SecG